MRGGLGLAWRYLAILCIGSAVVDTATADCASYCQSDYWVCIEASDSSTCSTQRAICVQNCISNGEGGENFGAIAFSPSTEVYGYSHDFQSQGDAEKRAVSECRAAGGDDDCEIAVWFRNSCGALASDGEGSYGAEWGESTSQAETQALNYCGEHSSGECAIRVSLCLD